MPNIQQKGLVGGQAGEPESGFNHGFFHPGVNAITLQAKNTYGMRLLPAFDLNIQDIYSDEFKLSVSSYRNPDQLDPDTRLPVFSSWYYIFKGYKFLGNGKEQFLSPLNRHLRDTAGVDPIYDCYRMVKQSKNPDWAYLIEKPKNPKLDGYQILNYPSRFMLANAIVQIGKDKTLENRIVVSSASTLDMLKATLNLLCPKVVTEIVDPNWPDLLYGDVTSLDHGLWATVKSTTITGNAAGLQVPGFHFSDQHDRLVNHYKFPINPNDEWGQSVLRGRYNIGDDTNVTKIWTAEEILDFMVHDGFLPYDLIYDACSKHWEVPPEPVKKAHFNAPEGEFVEPAAAGGGSLGQRPAPAGRPAPSTPPAPRVSAPAAPVPPAPRPAAPVQPQPPRPAAAPVQPPRQAAPPAPQAPRPPSSAPRAPGAAAPRPPGQAPQPPQQAPRPATPPIPPQQPARPPTPPPAPVAPQAPAAPFEDNVPMTYPTEAAPVAGWTAEFEAEFAALEARFCENAASLSAAEMQRYGELGDYKSACSQQ